MRTKVLPMFTLIVTAGLLIWAGAQAATTEGHFGDPVSAVSTPGSIQLAGSPNKLGDKYLSGKAGGRYGIGSPHSKAKGSKSKAKDGKAKDGGKSNAAPRNTKLTP